MFVYCFDENMRNKFEQLGFKEITKCNFRGKPTLVLAKEQHDTALNTATCFSQEDIAKFIVTDTMYFV